MVLIQGTVKQVATRKLKALGPSFESGLQYSTDARPLETRVHASTVETAVGEASRVPSWESHLCHLQQTSHTGKDGLSSVPQLGPRSGAVGRKDQEVGLNAEGAKPGADALLLELLSTTDRQGQGPCGHRAPVALESQVPVAGTWLSGGTR